MRMRPPLMPLSRAVLNVSPISTVARPCMETHEYMLTRRQCCLLLQTMRPAATLLR